MINIDRGVPSAYFPAQINKSQETQPVVPLQFPSTRNILWESKPVGNVESLSLTLPRQEVQLFVVEKTLRLAQRYADGRQSTSFLLGSVYPKTVEGGICFGIDRFDPGREVTEKIGDSVSKCKVPTAVVPGDHVILIKIKNEIFASADSVSHTKDEFTRSLQIMVSKIRGKDSLTLSHVISVKANVYCCNKENEVTIRMHCGAVVPDTKFRVLPIAPLSIIPTALARNLAGPLRLSDVQGTPKMGYITMDQTRKLLLLLESDPKVYNLPLIGIWISGVHSVHHPFVWASCLRYLNCSEIKDRVLHSSGSFLLLHYSVVQRLPDFWECCLDNSENLNFDLLSCQEDLHIDLHEECNVKDPLCFLLSPAPDGINKDLFNEALSEWKSKAKGSRTNETNAVLTLENRSQKSPGMANDENPRPSPSPHPSPTQGQVLFPPLPEDLLSISFDDMSSSIKKKDCLDNNNSNGTKGAAHSQAPAKQYSTKLSSNKSNNSFKHSREPFKQIIPQNNRSPRNISQESPKSNSVFTKEMTGNKWDKENTPLTYRSLVHVKNCHRQANVRRSKSPVLTKADQVEVNHSPCGYHKKRLQESEKENQNSRTQSKRCSCVSQNIKNRPNVELSGPRNYCPLEDRLPYSHQEKRPKTDFNELKGVNSVSVLSEVHHEKTCSNCSTVSVSNDEHVDNICADSSSWKNNEELSNNAKIIGDPEVPPVSPELNTFDDSTFQILPKQPDLSDNGNFRSQPGSVDCALDNSDANKSRDVNTRELEEQQRIIQRDKDDLTNQKLLQEQVKKQEDMIRVLQEQVRSLLKMKEAISSPVQDPVLPLTPASTPESLDDRFSHKQTDKRLQNNAAVSLTTQADGFSSHDSKPTSVTVGVNTGASLLWDKPLGEKSTCAKCCEYNRNDEQGDRSLPFVNSGCLNETNDVLTQEESENLVNLSEVAVQIDSSQSLPETLNTVDVPSYDELSSSLPGQNSDDRKHTSSSGESASSVNSHCKSTSELEKSFQSDGVPVKGREFYDKLLFQVKDLLSEHVSAGREGESSLHKSSERTMMVQNITSAVPLPTRESVVRATLTELEKMKHSNHEREQSGSSSIASTYKRSLSTSFIPDHPRLNYISMSVDDTFDEVAYVDEVASKYLSEKELKEFRTELRPTAGTLKRSMTRTVRFGSLPCDKEGRSLSIREVDFTWNNLSFCTKNYLTKYNLVEGHTSSTPADGKNGIPGRRPSDVGNSQESVIIPCKPPRTSPVRKSSEGDNKILDIQRLKSLPKLF